MRVILLIACTLGACAAALAPLAPLAPPRRAALAVRMAMSEEELDAVIEREVEAAFASLGESFASDSEEAAVAQIQAQGREVMATVMRRLEDDGQLLSSQLSARIEAVASERGAELLAKYDEDTLKLLSEMNTEREAIRSEVERLKALNDEYNALKAGGGIDRDRIVSSVSLIVGLAYLGSAINEGLKIALSSGNGDALTAGLNTALAALGIGYFFVRKGQGRGE